MAKHRSNSKYRAVLIPGVIGALLLIAAACLPATGPGPVSPPATPVPPSATPVPTGGAVIQALTSIQAAATPEDGWLALLAQAPYPYTTPLPPPTPTVLDGIYAKLEPSQGTPVPCRRCADYLPTGGAWKLNLDKGVFRIFHQYSGWRSLGSFTIEGEKLFLFNDPACYDTVGTYTWTLVEGRLALQVVEDTCQVDRRARNFSRATWSSCQPQSVEAAVTDHWSRPPGCELE